MSALGRLVASVILDNSEFLGGVENAKRAAASMATDIDKSLKQVESTVKSSLGGIAAAFAAGFGVAALKEAFDAYTKNAAALNDLALKAGTTIQWMSSVGPVAKLSATSLDEITSAAEKLSKGIVNGLTKETASANQALSFLGVSARDSAGRLKDSGALIDEIALKLNAFQDGTSKTTIAIDLFGKAGANMLPFLKDLAEYGARNAVVTQQQAQLAKQYEQDLVRLTIAKSALFRVISQDLLPVADAFVKTLLEMTKRTGGLKDQVDSLSASGGIRDFAMSGVRAIGLLLDAGDGVMRIFQAIGETIGAVVARITNTVGASADAVIHFIRGDYAKAWDDLKQGTIRDAAIVADTGARIRGVFEKPLAGDAFVATLEGKLGSIESALNRGADAARKSADGYKSVSDSIKAHQDAVDTLIRSLDVHVAKLQYELDYMNKWGIATKETTVAMTDAQLKLLAENGVLDAHAKLLGISTDALRAQILARAVDADALIAQNAGMKEYLDNVKKLNDAAAESVGKIVQQVQVEKDKIATMGMSADQITRYTIRQLEAKKAVLESMEGAGAYVNMLTVQINKLKDLADAQGKYLQLEQQGKLWTDLSDRAGKFFGDLIVNGGSAFDRLKQSLKSFAEELIALFAKRFILNLLVAGGVSGAAGAANAAAQGGSNALVNGASSAIGTYIGGAGTAIGGAYGAAEGFQMGWMSGVAGPTAGFAETAGATLSGVYDGVAAILADIPVYGWIALAVLAIAAYFGGRGGGPKTGGSALGAFDSQGNFISDQTSTINRSTTLLDETQQDKQAAQVGQSMARSWAQTLAQLGGTSAGMQFGIGWNRDPSGTAPSMVSSLVRDASGRTIFEQANRNVGRSDQELSSEIQLQAGRAVLAALQASNLPDYLARVFNGIDAATATAAQINDVMNTALALQNLFGVLSRNPMKDVAAAISNSENQFEYAMKSNAANIMAVAKAYDGTLASTQTLTTATQQYYQAQVQLLVGISNAKAAIDDVFGGSIRGIQLSVLDKQGQRSFYESESSDLQSRALASNDPAAIQRYAQQIAQDIAAAFNTLSPEQQAAQAADFIRQERDAQAAIDARLEKLQKDAADATQKILDDIKALIGANTDSQAAAANTQLQAANTQLAAAQHSDGGTEAIEHGLNAIADKLDALAQDVRR